MSDEWHETYKSDFLQGNKEWKIDSNDTYYSSIQDGHYYLSVHTNNLCQWQMGNFSLDIFKVSVSGHFMPHSEGVPRWGIVFRNNTEGGYRFLVDRVGYYGLFAINMYGDWSTILPWKYSGYLRQNDSVNTLEVTMIDDSIILSANGFQLAQVRDNKFSVGNLGLQICSDNTQIYAGARFKDFVVYTPSQDLPYVGGTCVHWDNDTKTRCGKIGRFRAFGRIRRDKPTYTGSRMDYDGDYDEDYGYPQRGYQSTSNWLDPDWYQGLAQFCEMHAPRCKHCNAIIRYEEGCDCFKADIDRLTTQSY